MTATPTSTSLSSAPFGSVVTKAADWLLHSGIRDASGGVARYYRAAEGGNLPVSTEITGYAVSTLAWLYRRTGDDALRDAAAGSAAFLTSAAWRPDLQTFPFETAPGSPAYFFDCGIIIRGLLAAARMPGADPRWSEVAELCGRSMVHDFLGADAIHPILELPSKAPRPYQKRWSREPGCFQLKSALAWRDLAARTGDDEMSLAWKQALDAALDSDASFLPGAEVAADVVDRLHAYSYFLEALLAEPDDPECRTALAHGIPRLARHLRELRGEFERSDVYAQLLRVRLLAGARGIVDVDVAAATEEAAAIPAFQFASSDRRLDGGFSFGRRGGELMPFANPVSTGFCVQALGFWHDWREGRLDPDLRELI